MQKNKSIEPPFSFQVTRTLGDSRFRLESSLASLAYNDATQTIRTVEENGSYKIWNLSDGTLRAQAGLDELATLWTLSKNGEKLATGGEEVSLWNPETGEVLSSLRLSTWVTALTFSDDGLLLAIGLDDGSLLLLNTHTGKTFHLLAREQSISYIAFSHCGTKLATASEDRSITLWDLTYRQIMCQLQGHQDRITSLAWHPSGNYLVSSAWDTTSRVWDVQKGEQVFILNGQGEQVHAAAFSPDGELLATADSRGVIWIWKPLVGKILHRLRGHHGEIQHLCFTSNGHYLVSGGVDARLILWNPKTGENVLKQSADVNVATKVALSHDQKTLAAVLGGSELFSWKASSGQLIRQWSGFTSSVSALTLDGHGRLWSGHMDGTIRVWEAHSPEQIHLLNAHKQQITSLIYDPKLKLIASASSLDGYVYCWREDETEPFLLIPDAGLGSTAECLAFIPGTNHLLVGGFDWKGTGYEGSLSLWDFYRQELIQRARLGCRVLTVHPRGNVAVVASLSNSFCLIDLNTLEVQREWNEDQGMISALLFHPHGKFFFSAGDVSAIDLWNLEGGRLHSFETNSPVRDLAISQDGSALFAAHANDTCSVIELK